MVVYVGWCYFGCYDEFVVGGCGDVGFVVGDYDWGVFVFVVYVDVGCVDWVVFGSVLVYVCYLIFCVVLDVVVGDLIE